MKLPNLQMPKNLTNPGSSCPYFECPKFQACLPVEGSKHATVIM